MSDYRPVPAVHPGEVLREEYLVPLKLSAGRLARALDVPRTRIERLANEQSGVTPDTALRLGRYFGTTPQFWLNLQANHDLAIAAGQMNLDAIEPMGAVA
ncbi:HigA family addiction module antitoxin [Oricola sp.]|uniref:HigA family addiction module antitoxin n=1 Tax=Oricola sp. TaxID=1979950 RepID=UPI0025E27BA3|nr:HigA family addiction module antitoxin [Oricola sp.]MCI5074756.1 HigA family addiction module antitoxin [Oricola sp.]